MFVIRNVGRATWRNPGRSVLLMATSLLLLCFFGLYLGSIWSNGQLLQAMGQRMPVTATITCRDGSRDIGLAISPKRADGFLDLGVTEPILTAESYGNVDKARMGLGSGTVSIYLVGANTMDAFSFGDDHPFLAGDEPSCIVNRAYVRRTGLPLEIDSALELNLFRAKYDDSGYTFEFVPVAPAQITVAGFFDVGDHSEAPDLICPAAWLRRQYDDANAVFMYNSATATVANPLLLNDFKAAAEAQKFVPVNAQAGFSREGIALSIDDRVFIDAASQIMRNIRMLRLFMGPVAALLLMLVTLISFFLTRSRRREISIARCLGRKVAAIMAELIAEQCLLALIGGLLAAPVLFLLSDLRVQTYLMILALFLCCEFMGSLISAALLARLHPMALLTKVD